MTTHTAFFYGTLMAPPILHRVLHGTPTPTPTQSSCLHIRPALLPGYTRHRVRGRDYPGIVPSAAEGAAVRGTYVTGLTARDLRRLDAFEAEEYVRRGVRVVLGRTAHAVGGEEGLGAEEMREEREEEEEEVQTETYVWAAGRALLEEGAWDFEAFVREKMGRWVGGEEMGGVDGVDAGEGVVGEGDPTGGRGVGGLGEEESGVGVREEELRSAV